MNALLRLLLPVAVVILMVPPASAEDDAYRAGIEEWHAARVDRLRQPDGWLSLVGLYPLSEGVFRFGSDPACDIVFPAPAPALGGELVIGVEGVHLRAVGQAVPGIDGEPVTSAPLATDATGSPTVVETGRFRFYLIERSGRLYLRLKDPESPVRTRFTGIERWPVDPRWRIVGRLAPYDPPRVLRVPDVLGNVSEEPCKAALEFEVDGRTLRLDPMSTGHGGFFLVFADLTTGVESYGGGRFLDVDPADEEGRVILDFNRATNPPCAFTPFATCPLPPEQNVLPIEVRAGEKSFGAGH